jgi:hypothetical protein
MFAGCCWRQSLVIDGGSGTSRGHGSVMRRPGLRRPMAVVTCGTAGWPSLVTSSVSGLLRDSAHVRQSRSRGSRCCPGVTVMTLGLPPDRARGGHDPLIRRSGQVVQDRPPPRGLGRYSRVVHVRQVPSSGLATVLATVAVLSTLPLRRLAPGAVRGSCVLPPARWRCARTR